MEKSQAINHLRKDPVLSRVLDRYTVSLPGISTNLFYDLLEAIISQQLSNKAATTIFGRFLALFPKGKTPCPEEILELGDEDFRSCGLSRQKSSYLKSLAEEIVSNKLVLKKLQSLSDEEVITSLTTVKGIGRWTAEMSLIFSLGRLDIFSIGDLGLRTAVAKLYGVDKEDKRQIETISQAWSPYRSLACLYLWKSLDNTK